jgi:D-3-phosphoglycerate dehydrogenase
MLRWRAPISSRSIAEDAGDGRFVRPRAARAYEADRLIFNTARGGIIDEKALYDALKANRIAGAALDVFDQELTPQYNPLLTLPNFIAAPHVAGVTREAVDRMGVAAVENILSVLDGKPIRNNIVNKEVLV